MSAAGTTPETDRLKRRKTTLTCGFHSWLLGPIIWGHRQMTELHASGSQGVGAGQ